MEQQQQLSYCFGSIYQTMLIKGPTFMPKHPYMRFLSFDFVIPNTRTVRAHGLLVMLS